MKSLPTAEQQDLRQWFGQPGRHILERVIESQVKKHAASALQDAITSQKYPTKLDAGNDHLAEAQRYQTFLDILKELTEQTENHQIAIIS